MASSTRNAWLVPTGLIVLSLIPVVAGTVRLTELTSGADVTPENARFFAAPVPVILHIIGASIYTILGAFQFVPDFRRRRPGWHRAAGRLLIPCGLAAALTGLWMTVFYDLPDHDGALLAGFRLVFGTYMAAAIVLGFAAIRRRDVARHRAWMARGYALGQGAGTQAVIFLTSFPFLGVPSEFSRALLMGAGWAVNLAVAEWIIRRQPARPAHGSRRSQRAAPARRFVTASHHTPLTPEET